MSISELEAAELEGTVALDLDTDLDLIVQIKALAQIKKEKNKLEKAYAEQGAKVKAELDARHARAFTINGNKVVEVSDVNGTKFDVAGFALAHPRLWKRFLNPTHTTRFLVK